MDVLRASTYTILSVAQESTFEQFTKLLQAYCKDLCLLVEQRMNFWKST